MHATRSPELLRIPEAAERLNVSRASVYRWIEEGRLPAVRLGGRGAPLRIPEAELGEWLEERRTSTDVGDHGIPRPHSLAERRAPGATPAVEARQPAGDRDRR
jgi:excisionase family DNA binding protein